MIYNIGPGTNIEIDICSIGLVLTVSIYDVINQCGILMKLVGNVHNISDPLDASVCCIWVGKESNA